MVSVGPALGDGFLVRIRDARSGCMLLSVTKHVSGKLERAARSEEAAVEHGQGESAGFGQLEARASECVEPVSTCCWLAAASRSAWASLMSSVSGSAPSSRLATVWGLAACSVIRNWIEVLAG